jgi:D-alanine-D-alanine ligase
MKEKVLILYTEKQYTPFNEAVSAEMISGIKDIISRNENCRVAAKIYRPSTISQTLNEYKPDLIFNFSYGFKSPDDERMETQADITEKLESDGHTILGSSASMQRVAQDKSLWPAHLQKEGIKCPVPVSSDVNAPLPRLCIEKPVFGACHRNVRIIDTQKEMLQRKENYLYQEYLPGPEFTVGLLEQTPGTIVFSPMEVKFDREPNALGTDTKPVDYIPDHEDVYGIKAIASKIFTTLKLRDYARLDFRIDGNGHPVIMDVNSMPNLDPENSFFPMLAAFNGLSYDELITKLFQNLRSRAVHQA